MKIAIVGTGISGLVVAHLLHRHHEVVIYEAADWIGGHTHTVDIETDQGSFAVDTGFIVFNPERYPGFVRLIEELGVPSRETTMGFSVRSDRTGLEYGASSLRSLFAQPRNLLRPSFWRMLKDIGRFNELSRELIDGDDDPRSLGAFLAENHFSPQFIDEFLIPMGAAIWSTELRQMFEFPAASFARFFHNHRFLERGRRRPWRTIVGGSQRYVDALVAPFRDRIRLRSPVASITRLESFVELTTRGDDHPERFDRVVIATHSDQALALLADPSDDEKEILSAIPYHDNDVVLHDDERLLPRRRSAWSSWNAHIPLDPADDVLVTYNMNILQGLPSRRQFLLTLNETDSIDPARILGRWSYAHPQFTAGALAAQRKHERINGCKRTYFCGAYWGYGFHEDGVQSGLRVAELFGRTL